MEVKKTRFIALGLSVIMVASICAAVDLTTSTKEAAAAPTPRIVKQTVVSFPKQPKIRPVGYAYTVSFHVTADNKALGRVYASVGSADVYRQLPGQRMTTGPWKTVGISNSPDGRYSYGSFTDRQYKPGTVTYLVKYKGIEVLDGPSGGSSYSIIRYVPSSASIGVSVEYKPIPILKFTSWQAWESGWARYAGTLKNAVGKGISGATINLYRPDGSPVTYRLDARYEPLPLKARIDSNGVWDTGKAPADNVDTNTYMKVKAHFAGDGTYGAVWASP